MSSSFLSQSSKSRIVPCILIPYLNDAVAWVTQGRRLYLGLNGQEEFVETDLPGNCSSAEQVQILVTGSSHLVGGVLEIIRPDVFFQSDFELEEERDIVEEYKRLATAEGEEDLEKKREEINGFGGEKKQLN